MYNFLRLIIFIFFIYTASSALSCPESFQDIKKETIQSIFSNPANYEIYSGQSGYVLFVKRLPNVKSMDYVFHRVSKALGKEFKRLKWQEFRGSVKEFEDLRLKVLDEKGNVRKKYLEMLGYAEFAKKHFENDMEKAFKNVSADLSKGEFKRLKWQQFHGSVKKFEALRIKILDEKGNVREKYTEMLGYANFADEHYDSDMLKAFKNVSAVLGGYWGMKKLGLGWKQFQGTTFEYDNLIELFSKYPLEKFQGVEGQERVAKEIFGGHNKRTYENVSILREMLLGSWEAFTGLQWLLNL